MYCCKILYADGIALCDKQMSVLVYFVAWLAHWVVLITVNKILVMGGSLSCW